MNSLSRALLSTLPALLLLTASSARADLPHESMYLTRSEIPDESLRGVIGVAYLSFFSNTENTLDPQLPLFVPSGDSFTPDGTVSLNALRPISGWDHNFQLLRKFPVVEQRGEYINVVIDAQTNERAWLHLTQTDEAEHRVQFTAFTAPEFSWVGIELYDLAPRAETRLYGAPRPEARWHPLSPSRPARRQGAVVGDLRIIRTHGNFVQVGELIELDQDLAPVGWVPLTDESGVLLIWPVYAAMC